MRSVNLVSGRKWKSKDLSESKCTAGLQFAFFQALLGGLAYTSFVTINFEINTASLALGRHIRMFVVDDVPSKLKGFSCNKGKVIEVIVRIGSSLHFHREKDLFLSSSKNSDRVHKRFDLVEVIT